MEAGEAIGASTSESQANVHTPETPPARDWRGPNDKRDHGDAVRQQCLNLPLGRIIEVTLIDEYSKAGSFLFRHLRASSARRCLR